MCPSVPVKIRDVEIDKNFFMKEEVSHPVILGQPLITASRIVAKVLNSGTAFAKIWSQSGERFVQFLTVLTNHDHNKRELLSRSRVDI